MKIRFLASVLLLIFLFSLMSVFIACSPTKPENTESIVTFTDAFDRKIALNKRPLRVAALIGSFADVWLLSGGDICAAPEDAWEDFGLLLSDAVNIGGAHSPDVERLLSANPDFVIASASTASNVKLADTLEEMGITVAFFDVDNFDDYLKMLDVCTDITGRKDLYEKNGLALKNEIDSIKKQYLEANIPRDNRKILLLRAASSFVKAKGSEGTILGEMLADLGCINIADSDASLLENLSVEAVMREEPYHIFVVTMGEDTAANESFENMIKENPAWSGLRAVREERLHIMDKKLFNLKPNARFAESYRILYEKLTEK